MIQLNIAQRNALAYSLVPTLREQRGMSELQAFYALPLALQREWMIESLAIVDFVVEQINGSEAESKQLMGVAV